MKQINLKAMAKINLGLDVVRRREDGYHDLRMVMQTVRLFDRIRLSVTRSGGVRLKTNLGFLPTDANNHACKAAQMLIDEFGEKTTRYYDLARVQKKFNYHYGKLFSHLDHVSTAGVGMSYGG